MNRGSRSTSSVDRRPQMDGIQTLASGLCFSHTCVL